MIYKVMALEEKILKHQTHLLQDYPNTQDILSQIQMIYNLKINNEKIEWWFRMNKISIGIINEMIDTQDNQ